jgi:hypothetical protein
MIAGSTNARSRTTRGDGSEVVGDASLISRNRKSDTSVVVT